MAEPQTEPPGTTHLYVARAWYRDPATWFNLVSFIAILLQETAFTNAIPEKWHPLVVALVTGINLWIRFQSSTRPVAISAGATREVHSIPPKDIGGGSVSETTRTKLLSWVLLVTLLGAPSCATGRPPTTAPTSPAVARLTQARTVLDAVRRVGLVVEQVQTAEIALYRGGSVPSLTAATHTRIQTAFKNTAASVIAATDALVAAVATTDPATVVQALRDGLKELSTAIGALSAQHATQLAGWLDTAAALIEVALL